jgi:hypothetical protein
MTQPRNKPTAKIYLTVAVLIIVAVGFFVLSILKQAGG